MFFQDNFFHTSWNAIIFISAKVSPHPLRSKLKKNEKEVSYDSK